MINKPWINYHHLFYFKTVAIEGGIARAAKKLRLGQPTLSTQIKQFEEMLGQKLFNRVHRRLELTEAGELILSYANEIFRLGDEMVDALGDRHSARKMQIQIGAHDVISKHIVADVVHAARAIHDCIVVIEEGDNTKLMRDLKNHQLDLIISHNPPPPGDGNGLYAKRIARMPVWICGTKEYASLKKGFPRSLAGQPFVMPSRESKLFDDVMNFLKLSGIHVSIEAQVQDTSLQKILAVQGVGLIPLAHPSAKTLLKGKELLPIGELTGVTEDLWLIAADRHLDNPVAAKLIRSFQLT
jgi:LysR family transcriptional activator of nhaA